MINNAAHRRRFSRKAKVIGGAAAAAVVAGGGFALAGSAMAGEDGAQASAGGNFSPYVDSSLYPAYDLSKAGDAGIKSVNLAFITAGGNACTPKWGGVQELGDNDTAKQIDDYRSKGGDIRVSFGGANGTELGVACSSADQLADAYGKVIDQFKLKKVDFDIEGQALKNTDANTRRAQAIAKLQKSHPDLDVSYTLPVLPEGLTEDGTGVLKNAKDNGVNVSAVNIMAMDYGPNYKDDMGKYATDAATATQKQVKDSLGITDDAKAWKAVAITPMIGVNDVSTEKFSVDDAKQVAKFATDKGMAWTSMWSATRDKQCEGGAKDTADATCSSIEQGANDFAKAFIG